MNNGHSLRWRLIVDEPRTGSRNMALDHALAECLRPGEGVVRLYGWSPPTISFGRNEPSRGLFDVEAAAANRSPAASQDIPDL